ncbi:hypothetical protein GCM10023328_17370 [Modestobacter marinus]|uniref:Uncharacterized protein n=1 Tax=Modestobacter marinus TaxID=477641 RepID=A0A846LS26_9ACTN|nr:hypothetical protein [Modestobacter marinus]NIH68208.1 hypothetical protein [Modestobacter marinus]GGL79492.1 hypothetical protein GCM10011589_39630 [Modestobacter marinus]
MTVLYRAMWTDARHDAQSGAIASFIAWCREKTGGLMDLSLGGSSQRSTAPRSTDVHSPDDVQYEGTMERAGDDTAGFARAELVEAHPDGARWQTTLRTWRADHGSEQSWVWVDVDAVGPAGITDVTIAAPRLVRDLLIDGVNPRSGPVELAPFPVYFSGESGGERLAETLTDLDRQIPTVVFADAPAVTDDLLSGRRFTFADVVQTTASALAGAVQVYVIDADASVAFCEAVGRDHGIADGACRVYQPVLDPAVQTPWRHPVVLPTRYLNARGTAAKAVVRSLGPALASRRPPASFVVAKALLDEQRRTGRGDAEWVAALEADNALLHQEMQEAKQSLNDLEDGYLGAVADLESEAQRNAGLVTQLDVALRENEWLKEEVAAAGDDGSRMYREVAYRALPEIAGSCSEAVTLARQHLSDRLLVPEDACRDLEDLDAAVEGVPWGQKAWDGFLALHAYAEHLATAEQTVDFWNWCKTSRHPRAWPASIKKLAMTESETVRQTPKLADQRLLPVDTRVSSEGRMHMWAHLKIATGGGMLIPRIYFYVDRDSALVHVGFFGPHKYMSNTKT